MEKKLLVFDLDGTLLNSKKEITMESKKAILKCKEAGYYIAYITGRGTVKTLKFLQGLPIDAFACNNGSRIYCENTLVQKNTIPFTIGKKLLERISKKKIFIVMEPVKYLNYDSDKIDNKNYFRTNIVDLPNTEMDMISVETQEDIKLSEFPELKGIRSGTKECMIVHEKATKSNALKSICDYYQIKRENVIAFGDDYSDKEVFANCGQAVAMQNAIKELKEMTTNITDSNDKNGVANYLMKKVLKGGRG